MKQMVFPIRMIMVLALMLAVISGPAVIHADDAVDIDAKAAIVADAQSGEVFYTKNADSALPAASMTKMMTEYLVWEAVETESNNITWDTTTQIGDYPYGISANNAFSGIGLKQNKDYTVRELYDAMAIYSDNATTIALAQLIAGSEGDFVKMMNDKAEEMGLDAFKFVNSTGLNNAHLGDNYPEGTEPDDMNLLSPRSAAHLAHQLITDYPESLDVASTPEKQFDGQQMVNMNWMLDHDSVNLEQFNYKGVDGLKTGYTEEAGNNFTGTAKREDTRLITVIMNADTKEQRFMETKKLLDFGFNNFEEKEVVPEGFQLEDNKTIAVAKGKADTAEIATDKAFKLPVRKGTKDQYTVEYHMDKDQLNDDGTLTAPVDEGKQVGTAELVYEGEGDGNILPDKEKHTVALVTNESVEKSNWFMLMLNSIGGFFGDLYSTVTGWF